MQQLTLRQLSPAIQMQQGRHSARQHDIEQHGGVAMSCRNSMPHTGPVPPQCLPSAAPCKGVWTSPDAPLLVRQARAADGGGLHLGHVMGHGVNAAAS